METVKGTIAGNLNDLELFACMHFSTAGWQFTEGEAEHLCCECQHWKFTDSEPYWACEYNSSAHWPKYGRICSFNQRVVEIETISLKINSQLVR